MTSRKPSVPAASDPMHGGDAARTGEDVAGGPWWSRRLHAVLESFGDHDRLHRGRMHARRGRVLDLTVRPHEVGARVQGSGPRPYEVAVGIAAVDEEL